jgi:hypothetical protein
MGIICKIIGHKRDRDRVWNDGLDFRSHCIRCRVSMIKDHQMGWRAFDRGRDFDLKRQGKPTH